ncbi:MAG: hypothetical protein ACKPKO_16685, partial [Candidatus Fonsibacter sp.]
MIAVVVDDILAPLSRLDCRGGFLVLGQHYATSSYPYNSNITGIFTISNASTGTLIFLTVLGLMIDFQDNKS